MPACAMLGEAAAIGLDRCVIRAVYREALKGHAVYQLIAVL